MSKIEPESERTREPHERSHFEWASACMKLWSCNFTNEIRALSAIASAALLIAGGACALLTGSVAAQDDIESVNARAYFFRLTAKYMHGDEPIDFDIVVGCRVRVTTYGSDTPSYDAFRDPIFYIKATRDGAAVMQIVPNACLGETMDNPERRVPKDFLPGAIWFDNAKDLTLGIGYISEDAFENPNSKLKFLGAEIHKATYEDWKAFRPIAAVNLLSPRSFIFGPRKISDEELQAHLFDKVKLAEWRPSISCYGYARYRTNDPIIKSMLQEHWPKTRPRYWRPDENALDVIGDRIFGMHGNKGAQIGDRYYRQYFRGYEVGGFATRVGGGTLYPEGISSDLLPLKADEALPWLTPELANAPTIHRDVDFRSGENIGFVYCYHPLSGATRIIEHHIPDYQSREFVTRVDGVPVEVADSSSRRGRWAPLSMFFEGDDVFYVTFEFSLN